jgi:hypothetical protein
MGKRSGSAFFLGVAFCGFERAFLSYAKCHVNL